MTALIHNLYLIKIVFQPCNHFLHILYKSKIKYFVNIMTISKNKSKKKWSIKYKKSINCNRPKGFSQKQYCKYGRTRKKR
jgi:hypothetical protein